MAVQWTIRGTEYGNCSCDYGRPCQFNSPTTHGNCEGVIAGHIEEGHFGDVPLDGLDWAMPFWFPGEVAEGNGRQQAVVDREVRCARRGLLAVEDLAQSLTLAVVGAALPTRAALARRGRR